MQQPVTGGSVVRRPVNVGTRVERIDRRQGTFSHGDTTGYVYEGRAKLVKCRAAARWFLLTRPTRDKPGKSRPKKAGQLTGYVHYDDRVASLKTPPRIGRKNTPRFLTDKDCDGWGWE